MYLPSSQYRSTSSVLTAWYARRRAASISASTSSNLCTEVSVVVRRDDVVAGCFAAFAGVLRDFVTALYLFANDGGRIVGRVEGSLHASKTAVTLYANAPREAVADLLVSPVRTASSPERSARRDRVR